ncbi:MAG: D-alanyl-D-alanine carboxypeptidase/D-alanyl-D-alanine-endopeptidase [Luteolibacter sp.]
MKSDRDVSPLKLAFAEWAAKLELKAALLGFVLLDEKGETVFSSPLGETALCPASSLKTLTTGAALGILGPEFRFETRLIVTAEGDLVLKGSGDPTLALEDINALIADAVAGGLKEVKGIVRVDASVFPSNPVSDHWNWGDIGNAYGAGAYGINVEHNRMIVSFLPGAKEGDAAKFLNGGPAPADMVWKCDVKTGPAGSGDGVMVYASPYGRVISLSGAVPLGAPFAVTAAISDPPAVALEALKRGLEKAGVKVLGKTGAGGTERVLAVHQSEPLPVIIEHLHRVSDNLESQCLFLTLGNHEKSDPAKVVRNYWENAGVSFEGLRLLDGSGLARANMIRPVDLARVNHAAGHGPGGQRFFESLSASLNGEVRSKIGAMSGVKTEVGFLRLKSGKTYTFALMANGLGPEVNFWQLRGELLEAVKRVVY